MQLIIEHLNKTYPNGIHALKDVCLEISTGMFGLLGPNGAGKSTLMRTLATLQEASSGSVHLNGLDVLNEKHKVKKLLGYLPQDFGFYKKDKPLELLEHFALLKGIEEESQRGNIVGALLKKVNLWDARTQKIGTFSGGMKQRLGIAIVLLGDPKLIIVDEPTAGLDPDERNRFHNLLSELGENIIVILSTHIVEDVSDLCTDMAIINKGEIIFQGSPLNAITELDGKIWEKEIEKSELNYYEDQYNLISSRLYAGNTIIHVYNDENPGDDFRPTTPSLEDVYFLNLKATK